jgi:hypothetical protein
LETPRLEVVSPTAPRHAADRVRCRAGAAVETIGWEEEPHWRTLVTSPLEPPHKDRVYLSASNRFYLALKTFGYSLLGYLILALVFGAFLVLGGQLSR